MLSSSVRRHRQVLIRILLFVIRSCCEIGVCTLLARNTNVRWLNCTNSNDSSDRATLFGHSGHGPVLLGIALQHKGVAPTVLDDGISIPSGATS